MSNAEHNIQQKVALEFKKEEFARFFSHHDMMRFFERILRRAELPVRYTIGFNPQPRMVFVSPLALGIESNCEIVEIEFAEYISVEDISSKLKPFMLSGIVLLNIYELKRRKKGQVLSTSKLRFSGFLQQDCVVEKLLAEIKAIEEDSSWMVERRSKKDKSQIRKLDVMASVGKMDLGPGFVDVEVLHSFPPVVRPDDIARRLSDAVEGDVNSINIAKLEMKTV